MKVADLIQAGPQHYQHIYMQTQTDFAAADHVAHVPADLAELAGANPGATLVRYADGSFGIDAGTQVLAVEEPDTVWRPGPSLSRKAWHYLHIVAGDDRNTYAMRK